MKQTNTPFNTPREIRQVLFQVPTAAATAARKALFQIGHEAQDQPSPAALAAAATKAIRAYEAI